jgi:hypothetical protein
MISQFWLYFLGAGIVMRVLTPPLHFKNKTITYFIRKKTKRNIHHIHIGLLFAITAFLLILLKGINNPLLFFAALGLSFIADEIFITGNLGNSQDKYFTKKGFFLSILSHLVIGIIMTLILVLVY